MNSELLIQYAPIILIVTLFLLQHHIVVTPDLLEKTHREILCEIELKYAKLESVADLRDHICDINDKITKIYELVVKAMNNR